MQGLPSALAVLLLALLLGNGLQQYALPGIPGPVLGMVLVLVLLLVKGQSSVALDKLAQGFIRYLSLFFIPVTVGIWFLDSEIWRQWPAILIATIPATLLTQALVAWLFDYLLNRREQP